jgi:HAD superfamily hydrolase (TIGR01509 family)
MKLSGAIFDLDGTLLDSMPILDTLGEDYLLSRGITPKPDVREKLKPMSLPQAAEFFQKDYGLTGSLEEIMCGINRMIAHKYQYEVQLKPDVVPFLRSLRRKGIKMCIATATDRYLAEPALERLQIEDYFSFILTCTETGFSKEGADIYEKALETLSTPKKETVVFEDALHAIKAAKAADFPTVGIYDASAEKDADTIKQIADRYIGSFAECEESIL